MIVQLNTSPTPTLFDPIRIGQLTLPNRDLVNRFRYRLPLATPDPDTFYTPGAAGYTDYPAHPLAA